MRIASFNRLRATNAKTEHDLSSAFVYFHFQLVINRVCCKIIEFAASSASAFAAATLNYNSPNENLTNDNVPIKAGCCGLEYRMHGFGERVCGFPSQPWWSGFSFGFFLLLHFLHHGSIASVVCPIWSLFDVQHYCGINLQPWKKAKEIKCHCERRTLWKNYSSAICGEKTCLGSKKCNSWTSLLIIRQIPR